MNPRKVYKNKLVGLTKDAFERMKNYSKTSGKSDTDALHDMIMGKTHFGPNAEAWIDAEMKRTGKTREAVLESLVLEAMSRASSPGVDEMQRENEMLARLLRKALEAEQQQSSLKPRQ